MELVPVLKIGEFQDELQRVIDAEFTCYSEADLKQNASLGERLCAILTRSNYTVSPDLLPLMPNLKIISTSGVGYDGIPVVAAREKNIVVTNTPEVLNKAVSELAVGLLLALLRRIPAADKFVRDGNWNSGIFPLSSDLAGKRVGIVGLGRIGQEIAQRLSGFDVTLAYSDPSQRQVPYEYFGDVLSLAHSMDILVICCPGGAATRHLINADVLSGLGSNGYLVNVSRGSVIDESALVDALKTGVIRGAALDVFEAEPLKNMALLQLPNTILTPHMASSTEETRHAMLLLALDNIRRVLGGAPALTPI